MPPLLEGVGLVKHFSLGSGLFVRRRTVHAVNGVDLELRSGETLGLIGESGCGKTTLGRVLAGLYPATAGSVRFRGEPLKRKKTRRRARRAVQMVFQDPFASLDPRMTAGAIVEEPLRIHRVGSRRERRERAAALFAAVGLDAAWADRYPHEFSGGQRQRIGIARALALEPAAIVADEPVSALDVSIRSQVLNLLLDLRAERGLAWLFVSHDLAAVDFVADRVAVMYLGRIVELADRRSLFASPRHPYTVALRAAAPEPGRRQRAGDRWRAGDRRALAGEAPSALSPPPGCAFHPRCPKAGPECRVRVPTLEAVGPEHAVACHRPEAP